MDTNPNRPCSALLTLLSHLYLYFSSYHSMHRYKSLNQAKEDGAVTVNIGVFLNSVLNFVVISLIIFAFVKTLDNLKRKKVWFLAHAVF